MNQQLLTGRQFDQQFQGKIFVKLTNQSENHHGFQFQTGLNIDTIPFNPQGDCQPGGIYFCSIEQLPRWLYYNSEVGQMFYARFVTIPDQARVWIESNQFKADHLILGERQWIGDLEI